MVLLNIEKLVFGFTQDEILFKDFSLSLKRGEFVYIHGQNAIGKSSLLKTIVGIYSPLSGKIEILGEDPKENPKVLKRCGIVVDGMGLYKDMSLKENILYFGKTKGMKKEQILLELERYEKLWKIDFSKKYKASSHGMRKIAKLCIAFLNDPDILLLDEPELSLDEERTKILISILKDLKKNGKACLLFGTNPDLFDEIVDKRMIIQNKMIVGSDVA